MHTRLLTIALAFLLVTSAARAGTVAAGANHTVVVTPDGTVWVWGSNSGGQIGDGTTTARPLPKAIATLTGIVAVAAGTAHTLALKSDGTVYAWGHNGYGQLGDGTTTTRLSPVQSNVSGIVAIAAGEYHSAALASDGRVWVWGRNSSGQVGKGSLTTSESTPYMVTTLTSLSAIAAGGSHTLTVKSDGTVWVFGENGNGQLGVGSTTDQSSPVQMTGVTGASAVAAGYSHSLVKLADGTLRAAGYNGYGQLGTGNTTQQTSSVAVASLTSVATIAAGDYHSLAVRTDGTFLAWGANHSGTLGDGTTTGRTSPTVIAALSNIDKATAGGSHTLAVTATGVVSTWGANGQTQLGDGTAVARNSPGAISGINYAWKVGTPVFSVAGGTYTTDRTVVITSATAGATIHYTLDGNTPTQSDPSVSSGGSVLIDQTRTLKAKAWNGSAPESEVQTAVYTMQVATPSFSPSPTTYTTPQMVTLSVATSGASLRYTVDGSTPTAASPLYTAPFQVATTTTVRVLALRANWNNSPVNAGTYTMNFGTLAAPGFSPAGGTFPSSVTVTMTAAAGTAIRYTTNGSTPTTSSTLYTAPLALAATTTLKARAFHPDYTMSAITTGVYTVDVEPVTFTPTAGSYAPGQAIVVATPTAGATIRYTTNGNEPTESDPTIASGDTLLVGSFTLKARAWKTGATTAPTTTAAYTLTGDVTPALLAGGDAHSLATRVDGSTFAWGSNSSGRLGDGTTTRRLNPVLINGLTGVVRLSAGDSHSVAIRSDGRVLAWGANSNGQLGDGTTSPRTTPTQSPGALGAVAISAGGSHTLALYADGTVRAWGANSNGQLGDATTTQRTSPVVVTGLSGVSGVAACASHSLAVTQSGAVYAWGNNANGQLGDGTTTLRTSPTLVTGLADVVAVDCGMYSSVALKSDGTVATWGYNGSGQLGDGTSTQRTTPVPVLTVTTATAISAGQSHVLALLADGTVVAWGNGLSGQVGDGAMASRMTPVAVPTLTGIVRVEAGGQHSLAANAAGDVWAWGRNTDGQLGDGTMTNRELPVAIAGAGLSWSPVPPTLSDAAGLYFVERNVVVTHPDPAVVLRYTTTGANPTPADAVVASGASVPVAQSLTLKVAAWKTGAPPSSPVTAAYELKAVAPTATPTAGAYATPQTVALASTTGSTTLRYTLDGSNVVAASPAYGAPLVIDAPLVLRARALRAGWTTSDLTVLHYWVTGAAPAAPVLSPAPGAFVDDVMVTATSATPSTTLRYTLDGTDPNERSPELRVALVLKATTTVRVRAFKYGAAPSAVTAGVYSLDAAGAAATPTLSPAGGWFTTAQTVTVTGPVGATLRYTTTGADPSATDTAIASGGTISVPQSGVIKLRAFAAGLDPSAVRRADFVITGALAAGDSHSMALRADGTVWTWGDNASGQIGDTLTADRLTPVQVLSGAVAIAAKGTRSLALKADGTVWAWGNNVRTPTQVPTLTTVTAIAQGVGHALALKANGTLWAWGENASGQLGDGTTSMRTTPVQVVGLTGVTAIAAGAYHSVAISAAGVGAGRAWAWGQNQYGQLGDPTQTAARSTPNMVAGLEGARAVTAGWASTLTLGADGTVLGFGQNSNGDLGVGETSSDPAPQPRPVGVVRGGVALAAGSSHILALDREGRLWLWGSAGDGRLALVTSSGAIPFPQLGPLPNAVAFAGGGRHSLVNTTAGAVWAFGYGGDGQLGNNDILSSSDPVAVTSLSLADQTWLQGDPDGDGVSTWREYLRGLDPLTADSNRDGVQDGIDTSTGGDPTDPDVDHDGLANWRELPLGTDPFNPDSDGDTSPDGVDAFPLDPTRWLPLPPVPGDVTPPVITLTEPRGARPIP